METIYYCHVCKAERTITQNMETNLLICNTCHQDFIEERRRPTVQVISIENLMMIIQQIVNNGQLNQTLNESLNADPITIPTDDEFIRNIKAIMLPNSLLKNDCSICCDDFQRELKGCELPCGHIYHETCIKDWLQINHVCPICRHELPKQEQDANQSSSEEE